MKRILLLISVALMAVGASAQSFEFSHNDELFEEDTIRVINVEGEYTAHLKVKNISSTAKNIEAKVYVVSLVEGSRMSFCHGQCIPMQSEGLYTSSGLVVYNVAPEATTGLGEAHDTYIHEGNIGTTIARITYFDKENVNDSISVVVKYTYDPTGIENNPISVNKLYPNPANNVLNLEYTISDGEATAEIYNVIGKKVRSIELNASESQKTIETSAFPNGIYYIRYFANGKAQATDKFIINHN